MKIEELIAEVLYLQSADEISDETGPGDIQAWDSLGHINIISAIEEEYEIEVDPEEIAEIMNVGDIKKMLAAKT